MKGLIVDAGGYDPEITLLKKGASSLKTLLKGLPFSEPFNTFGL